MKISNQLQKELDRVISELTELNPPKTKQEELELYEQAMSKIEKDTPEIFSLFNSADQLAYIMAK